MTNLKYFKNDYGMWIVEFYNRGKMFCKLNQGVDGKEKMIIVAKFWKERLDRYYL